MRIFCKECKLQLSKQLSELEDKSLINENDGEDYLPEGFFVYGDGIYDKDSYGKVIINIKDLTNCKHHSDSSRLNGCCGLDGLDGLNIVCRNNHEVGTESSDCWMAHYICFDLNLIEIELT